MQVYIQLSADTYFDFDRATLKVAGKEKIDEEVVRPMSDAPTRSATTWSGAASGRRGSVATVGMIGMGAVSYGYGLGNHRHVFSVLSLALAIALVLMVIVDLDWPGRGFIRVNERSMIRLQTELHASAP